MDRAVEKSTAGRLGSRVKGIIYAKMVNIIKFLFFAQKVSSGMGASRPKIVRG